MKEIDAGGQACPALDTGPAMASEIIFGYDYL
jgi:hypothetical protein